MKETIFEFYRQYAPNVHITDEEISSMEKFYQGDVNKFINDFKQQIADPQNIQFDRVTAAGQASKIHRAYGEADVDVMLAEEEKERKLKQEEIPEVDDNVDPMSLLDNFYNGNKTIVQDYHHVNQLLSKYDFDVRKDTEAVIDSRSGTYSRRNKLVITAPNGNVQEIFLDTEADIVEGVDEDGNPISIDKNETKNKELLTDFFNANVDKESESYKKGQENLVRQYSSLGQDYYNAVSLSDREKTDIKSQVNEIDFNETYTEVDPTGGFSQFSEVKTKPEELKHKQILNEAKEYLLEKEGKENPTEEEIHGVARNMMIRKMEYDARQAKGDEYIDSLDKDSSKDSWFFANLWQTQETKKLQAETYLAGKAIETSAGKDLEDRIDRLIHATDNFDLDPDVIALNTILDKYEEYDNSEQLMYNMSDEDREKLNALSKKVSGKIFDHDAEARDVLGKVDYLEEVPEQLEIARRSFNATKKWFDKFTGVQVPRVLDDLWTYWARQGTDVQMILNGARQGWKDAQNDDGITTLEGLLEGAGDALFRGKEKDSDWFKKTFPHLTDEAINKYNIERQLGYEKLLGKYRKDPQGLADAWSSGRMGDFTLGLFGDFLPIVGTIALTRGRTGWHQAARVASMIGFGGGSKRSQYDFEEYINPTAGKTSLAQKMFISAGHGLAEYIGESLTTFRLVDNMISPRGLPSVGGKEVIKALAPTWGQYLRKNFLTAVPSAFAAEGASEALTQVMQNVLDKRPILENVGEAFYGGMIMGGGMGVMSTVHGAVIASTVDGETRNKLSGLYENYHKEVGRLNDLRRRSRERVDQSGKVSKAYKNLIEAQANKVKAAASALDGQYQQTIKNLPAFNKVILGQILKHEAIVNDKRLEYNQLEKEYQKGNITKEELDQRRFEVEKEVKKELEYIDDIKSGKLNQFTLLKDSLDETDQKKYNEYLDKAETEGAENVETRAEEMFFEDKYDEYMKKWKKSADNHNKNPNRRHKLVVKNTTKEEAIKIVEAHPTWDQNTKDKTIENIKQGYQNGFQLDTNDPKTGERIRTAYGVKTNAVGNRRIYTIPHEVAHAVAEGALTIDEDGNIDTAREKEITDGIKEYAKNALPDVYAQIKDQPQYEVLPYFLEYFMANGHKVADHAAFFGSFVTKTFPDFDFSNPAELIRFVDSWIKTAPRGSLDKAKRTEAKHSVEEDPKGYARRRDKLNKEVQKIINRFKDPGTVKPEEEKISDFIWNEDIASEALAFVIENKILDTYILGKRPTGIAPTQWINDVYSEFISVSNNYDGRIKDADGRPDYFGWLMGNLGYQALDVTKAVIKEQQERAKTVDIDEARGIAEQTGDTIEDYGFTEIAEKLGVPTPMVEQLAKIVNNEIARYIKEITEGVTINKDVSPLFAELNKRFAQATVKNPGGGNWRIIAPLMKDLKAFVENNTATILTEITNEYAAKNIPQIIEKVIDGQRDKGFQPYPKWVGKKIARELKSETGKTSGPQLMRKTPSEIKKLIDNPQPLVDVYVPKGKANQAKKEGLAINLSQRLVREILQNDLLNFVKTGDFKNSPLTKRLSDTQSLFDRTINEAKAAELVRQSDRIKNSTEKAMNRLSDMPTKDAMKIMMAGDDIREAIRRGATTEAAIRQNLNFRSEKKIKAIIKIYDNFIGEYQLFQKLPKVQRSKIKPGIKTLDDFINQEWRDIQSDEEMFGAWFKTNFGVTDMNAVHFEDGRIETARRTDKEFIQYLKKKFKNDPKLLAKWILKFMMGHTATAGRIANKRFGNVNGVITVVDDAKGVEGSRFQNYEDTADVLNTLLLDTLGIKWKKVNQTGKGTKNFREGGYELTTSDGNTVFLGKSEYKLNSLDSPTVVYGNRANDPLTHKESEKEAKEQEEAMFEYLDFLDKQRGKKDENGNVLYDDLDFMLALKALNSNMKTMLRRSAPYRYRVVGWKQNEAKWNQKEQLKYEHIIPAGYVLTFIADHYLTGKTTKAKLEKLMSQYEVAIIPNSMDIQIPMGSLMARGYQAGDNALSNRYYTIANFGKKEWYAVEDIKDARRKYGQKFTEESLKKLRLKNSVEQQSDSNSSQEFVLAMRKSLDPNAKRKGASVIDFDDTLATTKSKIKYKIPRILPDGRFNWHVVGWGAIPDSGSLTPAEFAQRHGDLVEAGAIFDFSEFNKVIKGKKGPFFNKAKELQKRFGTDNMFVLTARPPKAAPAIAEFLRGIGLEIPLQNIVGLENGTPEAKASWITSMVARDYNDILFADDAIKNTKAVADVLEMFNIGGKIYEARQKFSVEAATEEILDKILNENNPEAKVAGKTVSGVEAKERGKPGFWLKELFNFRLKYNLVFVPPSAEDLRGLWDNHIANKGRKGESDKVWFDEAILRPYARAERAMDRIKLNIRNQFKDLKKRYGKEFISRLYNEQVIPEFTEMDAVRVYLFNKAGHDIPGVTAKQLKALLEYVNANTNLKGYADDLFSVINQNIDPTLYNLNQAIYPPPTSYWKQQDTGTDIESTFNMIRDTVYQEFIDNKNNIFTPEIMNKIEAIYGTQFRRAMEDMFFRMEEGVNRNQGQINNPWIKWLNFATGNIMFVNIRSALLQLISMTNFIELTGANSLINTMARVVDRKQWVADFTKLWNSEFLKNRRDRGKIDVVQEEIMRTLRSEKDPFLRLASLLQNKGYAPTRFMDSLAIALGGAAYYRNLVNYYIEQGLDRTHAERRAMRDFREKAEMSQQSSRADLISMEQASVAGRIFLTFQNVTMQYTRLGKKALFDFKNGRRVRNPDGTYKSLSDSRLEQSWKMLQFFAYQNLLFQGLQSAVLLLFGLGEDDESLTEDKKIDYLNSVIDSILRGTGILGGFLSVAKNIGIELARGNNYKIEEKILDISPTLSTKYKKAGKVIQGLGKGNYKDILIETPSLVYGLPTDRVARLIAQIEAGIDYHDQGYKAYERLLLSLGWSTYNFGLDKPPTILDLINMTESDMRRKTKKRLKKIKKPKKKKR